MLINNLIKKNKPMKNKSSLNNAKRKQPNKVYLPVLLIAMLVLCFANVSKGQAPSSNPPKVIFKSWIAVAESSNHIDVSYCVVKCGINTPNQVFISLFNENPTPQTVNMTVIIKNNSNDESFTSTISYNAGAAKLVKPDCSVNEATSALKINLPQGYDPENISVTVNFN